jgi:hypothetical protein
VSDHLPPPDGFNWPEAVANLLIAVVGAWIGAWFGASLALRHERRRREEEDRARLQRVLQQLALEVGTNETLLRSIINILTNAPRGALTGVRTADAVAGLVRDAAWADFVASGVTRAVPPDLLKAITAQHAATMGVRTACARDAARVSAGIATGLSLSLLSEQETAAAKEIAANAEKALPLLGDAQRLLEPYEQRVTVAAAGQQSA